MVISLFFLIVSVIVLQANSFNLIVFIDPAQGPPWLKLLKFSTKLPFVIALKINASVTIDIEMFCAGEIKLNHAHFGRFSTVITAVEFNSFNCWFLLVHSN